MSQTSNTSRKGRKWLTLLVGVLGIVIASIGFVTWVATAGRVEGEEFSPTDFRKRTFSYVEIPIIHKQVRPVSRRQVASPMRGYLLRRGYLPMSGAATRQWHLVWDNRTDPNSAAFDSRILCAYLDQTTPESDSYWVTWSELYPEQADVLWPRIVALAQLNQYLIMPDLFLAAESSKSASDLDRRIIAISFDILLPTTEALMREKKYDQVTAFCEYLLDLDPAHEEANRLQSLAEDRSEK